MSNAQFNPEMQAKWLAALESGNYKQGRNALRNIHDEFCCLGVACHVLGIEFERNEDRDVYFAKFPHASRTSSLDDDTAELLGIRDLQYTLADMNDSGLTFKEIAGFIKEHNASIGR